MQADSLTAEPQRNLDEGGITIQAKQECRNEWAGKSKSAVWRSIGRWARRFRIKQGTTLHLGQLPETDILEPVHPGKGMFPLLDKKWATY